MLYVSYTSIKKYFCLVFLFFSPYANMGWIGWEKPGFEGAVLVGKRGKKILKVLMPLQIKRRKNHLNAS